MQVFLVSLWCSDKEQDAVRPTGGTETAAAEPPFDFTVVCLAVLRTCGSIHSCLFLSTMTLSHDIEQYVVRPAEGAAVAGADPPFNVTVVCLAVYVLVALLGIGLGWLLQQVAKQGRLSANRKIEHSTYLPLKE